MYMHTYTPPAKSLSDNIVPCLMYEILKKSLSNIKIYEVK